MSKYKVGDKIILTVTGTDERGHYPNYVLNNNFYLWEQSIDDYSEPLSTYTEPLEAKIRRQAAEITRLLAENKELKEDFEKSKRVNLNMGRRVGQNEAWELVRKIFDMETNDIEDIFIKEDAWNLGTVLNNYTYQEAAAKVAEWERAKEEVKAFMDKLTCDKLSDIISHNNAENKALNNPMYWWAGSVSWRLENMKKTGRHIDIDGFLKQIGEEQE